MPPRLDLDAPIRRLAVASDQRHQATQDCEGRHLFKLIALFGLVSVAMLAGCTPGPMVDAHVSAVVVEKIEPSEAVDYGMIRAVISGDDPRLVAFSLTEDPARPLAYIWNSLEVGSNVAFVFMEPNGQPRYHPDNIFSLTTAEIALLDKPDDLDQVIGLAKERRRATLLKEQQQRDALNKLWHQAHAPKE